MNLRLAVVFLCAIWVPAASATTLSVTMSADDAFEAFLATDDAVEGTQFVQGTTWVVPQSGDAVLTPGVTNYLHVRARDIFGAPSMVVGSLSLDDDGFVFPNGLQDLHTDDVHWTVSLTGFGTDTGTPVDLGPNGSGPWGLLGGIDPAARHIWSDQTAGEHYFSVAIMPTSATTTTTTIASTSTTTSTTTSTSTTTTIPAVTTFFPAGKKLLVKQKKSGTQRLIVLAMPPGIGAATACEVAGELVVEAVGAGAAPQRFALDAAFWRPLNSKKPERGCKYRKGPVVAGVLLKPEKVLKVIAGAPDLGVPLATDPRPVRIELRHGDVRHCLEFGGAKGQHKTDKKLLAKQAAAASVCPGD